MGLGTFLKSACNKCMINDDTLWFSELFTWSPYCAHPRRPDRKSQFALYMTPFLVALYSAPN